jgi:hypothetical protein
MPVQLPYLSSNKNVGVLFEKIASAKVPPKFTHEFLQNTIGLKGTNDRPLVALLRTMGFLDQSNTPTPTYSLLKNKDEHRGAIADGVRYAYGSLFNANEDAHDLSGEKLKGLVSQVTGTDADMSARIASTFSVLAKLGDFVVAAGDKKKPKEKESEGQEEPPPASGDVKGKVGGLRTEFHYNIQVHLPANGVEETYLNIFNAIRKTFQ